MDSKQKLIELAPQISEIIDREFPKIYNAYKNMSPDLKMIIDNIVKVSSGGKRVRGAFVYYGYKFFGGKDMSEILKAAAFVEVIHTHILIADDVIDEDPQRRGVQTIHDVYYRYHKENFTKKKPKHFGNSIAICANLISGYAANKFIMGLDIDNNLKVKALDDFYEQLILTGYGEALDVLAEVKDEITVAEAMEINLLKTSTYTYEAPLRFGAMLAGAKKEDLEILTKYSDPGGKAFQIQDDILGMFGDEEKIGKPVDSDLKEGKRNVLTLKTIELAAPKDKKRFLELLGNKKITETEVQEARDIITRSGALDYAKDLAVRCAKKAIEAVKDAKGDAEAKEFLIGIAEYLIERKS